MIIVERCDFSLNIEILCFSHFKEYGFTHIENLNWEILTSSAFVRSIAIVSLKDCFLL